jgi:repressor LexA
MNEPNLTPRQLQILRLIRQERLTNGYSPTMQEIGDALGLTKVTVFEHVGALQKKGLLTRGEKHTARSLQVSDDFVFPEDREADEAGSVKLPLVGRIAAGSPIEAIEDTQTVDLGTMFDRGDGTFVLEVHGDSMVDEHICDGDYVVCRKANTARNGEIVVAIVDGYDATLKTFYKESDGRIRLQPANANYEPIYPDRLDIQGIVTGLIRQM